MNGALIKGISILTICLFDFVVIRISHSICVAFSSVLAELWKKDEDEDDGYSMAVNPTALKSQVQKFAPRFMGYNQQDAQEFLRYLLEGLHEDVNRVAVKPRPIEQDIPDSLR